MGEYHKLRATAARANRKILSTSDNDKIYCNEQLLYPCMQYEQVGTAELQYVVDYKTA
jgi:hypothetical protein